MGGRPPQFYSACKTGKLLDFLFKDHDALAVQMDKFSVLTDLFLKVLPEFFSGKFRPGVGGLLVVAGNNKADFGVEHRHIVRDLVQCGHQVHNAGEENWKHGKRRLLNELRFGFQFLCHV